jgi:hypothetical protein
LFEQIQIAGQMPVGHVCVLCPTGIGMENVHFTPVAGNSPVVFGGFFDYLCRAEAYSYQWIIFELFSAANPSVQKRISELI